MSDSGLGWSDLLALLLGLDPSGQAGFEGAISKLLQSHTGTRFYLAKTGDQPVGDIYSPGRGIAIQTKRYGGKNAPSDTEILGDADRAILEAPSLDLYIVATTKSSNQLKRRLDLKAEADAVDMLLLELSNQCSELGALCLAYWESIRDLLSPSDELEAWVSQERNSVEVNDALQRLDNELAGFATYEVTRKLAIDHWRNRVNSNHLFRLNQISVTEAIARPALNRELSKWWREDRRNVAVLHGEEGMGKTWAAAAFVQQLHDDGQSIVVWLDSLVWADARSVDEIVDLAIRAILPPEDGRLNRLRRKVFLRWQNPVLIVLDGVNERGAIRAAERILHDLSIHRDQIPSQFRLLVTTRTATLNESALLRSRSFPVPSFDDNELNAALAKFAPDVDLAELTNRVKKYAAIPRYFQVCIQLREKLGSISGLTIELILWADLENKLSQNDPQWRSIQDKVGDSPTAILAALAEEAEWPNSTAPSISPSAIRELIPEFSDVRRDLMEQRVIASSGIREIKVSPEHIVLGWALVLRNRAESLEANDREQITDELQQLLEPAASGDLKARAVHAACVLSGGDSGDRLSDSALAAIFRLGIGHHNSPLLEDGLGFFTKLSLNAYALAVEDLFQSYLLGDLETKLIFPLASRWRDESEPSIQPLLERWLRLIFPGDQTGSKSGSDEPPPEFSVAVSAEQLRLSYAAISIISYRPDHCMLQALFNCHRSVSFCYADSALEGQRFPIKSPYDALRPLLHWHYGEAGLEALASQPWAIPGSDLEWFARQWRLSEFPANLGEPGDIMTTNDEPLEELHAEILDSFSHEELQRNLVGLGILPRTVFREELPDPTAAQVDAIKLKLRTLVESVVESFGELRWDRLEELLPLCARFAPEEYNAAVGRLWICAVQDPGSAHLVHYLDELIPTGEAANSVIEAALAAIPRLREIRENCFPSLRATELIFLCGTDDQILQWLKGFEEHDYGRGITVFGQPSTELITRRGLSSLAGPVREEVEAAERDNHIGRLRFWCSILGYIPNPDIDTGNWAIRLAEQYHDDHRLCTSLFNLVTKIPDEGVFRPSLACRGFQRYHDGTLGWWWGRAFPAGEWPEFTFAELNQLGSFVSSGCILLAAGLDQQLLEWGTELSEVAMNCLDLDPPVHKTALRTQVDLNGRVIGTGPTTRNSSHRSSHTIYSGVWGVDRESSEPPVSQQTLDSELEEYHQALEESRSTARKVIADFNAFGALRRWSELAPDEFKNFAKSFLQRFDEADRFDTFHLGLFAEDLFVLLLGLEPEDAFNFGEWTKKLTPIPVNTHTGALPWRLHILWQEGFNEIADIVEFRRHLIESAPNDEELLWHCLAAIGNDNATPLRELAHLKIESHGAVDRALGVTLLAFVGLEEDDEFLKNAAASDLSYWVRDHASWAQETNCLEHTCQRLYQQALESTDLKTLACRLGAMRLSLSPLCRGWRIQYRLRKSFNNSDLDAYHYHFWYHWDQGSKRKNNIKLCGRKLKEFCRGLPLKSGVTDNMAPWGEVV